MTHYTQTRQTIEEVREILGMNDATVRECVDPDVVRGLAQRVIDLEQTVLNLEPSADSFEALARFVELGSVKIERTDGRRPYHVALTLYRDDGTLFADDGDTLIEVLSMIGAKASARLSKEHALLAAMLRLLAPTATAMPYVADSPVVLSKRAREMIESAEAEIVADPDARPLTAEEQAQAEADGRTAEYARREAGFGDSRSE